MNGTSYINFVKPCEENLTTKLSGTEAQQIYLDEIKDANKSNQKFINKSSPSRSVSKSNTIQVSDKDLFLIVQNNDTEALNNILSVTPDKLHILDDFGWSLLMIACQANAIDVVNELLRRGIDTSVRDKAGNSAQSLVIRNKNYDLADVLLSYKKKKAIDNKEDQPEKIITEPFTCDICDNIFPDKIEHLSSTLHNICASKGKKIPANYVIPQTNRGYQLMLKGGWDRESGLGKDGVGKRYPIKAVQKRDRKGLGHEKKKQEEQPLENHAKHKIRRKTANDYTSNKRFEIKFRREFY